MFRLLHENEFPEIGQGKDKTAAVGKEVRLGHRVSVLEWAGLDWDGVW